MACTTTSSRAPTDEDKVELNFDPKISYECVQCGRGCFNAWDIYVEPQVVERLKDHALTLRVIEDRGQAFAHEDGRHKIFKSEEHPRCGFLEEDMLCSIHREIGYEAKPLACQQYPFLLTQTPDGVVHVSAAYSCTAVREECGPPLAESRASIEDLVARGGRIHRLGRHLQVLSPWLATYTEIKLFEEELLRRLGSWDGVLEGAIGGLGSVLSSQFQPEEDTVLGEGLLAHSWVKARELSGEVRSRLQFLHSVLTMGLLKPCLPGQNREEWRKIDEALFGEVDLELADFNWSGPLADLELWVNQSIGNRFDAGIDRYQSSLFFRKAHLTMGGLLPGLWLLWSKPAILRLLTGLQAWKHEREAIQEDFLWALERVETRLVGHTFDTVQVYQQFARQTLAICATSFAL